MFSDYKIFQRLSKMFNNLHGFDFVNKVLRIFKKKCKDDQLCTVCFESFPSKNFVQCQTDHQICKKCLIQIAKTHIYSLSYEIIIKGYPCPHYDCQEHLSYETCGKFFSKKMKHQIQTKIYEAMLLNAKIKFEKCRKCGSLSEIFDEKIFNCPNCFYKFCYNCNRKCNCKHDYDKCVERIQKRNDQLTEALIHKCHRCFTPFIKDLIIEGCNEMTCKCGAMQCYNCREPIYSSHECSGKKLSGQEIHERDVANAKLKQFVHRFI